MAMPKRLPIDPKKLQGFKYFRKLLPLFDRLHDDACDRDRSGNRKLHFDQYIALELLFFFKHILGCRHLLSHRANGIEIQVYLAIPGAPGLIALWTGKKPTLRTVEMIRFFFIGWATQEELEAHIAKLQEIEG